PAFWRVSPDVSEHRRRHPPVPSGRDGARFARSSRRHSADAESSQPNVRNIRENRHVVVFGLPRHTRLEYNMPHLPRGRDRRTDVETSPRRAGGTRWCREGDVVGGRSFLWRDLPHIRRRSSPGAPRVSSGIGTRSAWSTRPSTGPEGRPRVPRLYSFRDLVALKVVKSLLDNGMSLQRVRRAWDYLNRRAALDKHLSEVKLITDGVSIFKIARRNGEIIDALRDGQLAFFVAIDEIATGVESKVGQFREDRDRFVRALREA